MRLIPPTGFLLYGGATPSAFRSGDGSVYWTCSARYPDGAFGQALFRQVGEQPAELLLLPRYEGRGGLQLSPDGLYLTVWHASGRECHFLKVQGFVGTVHTETTGTADETARAMASRAQQSADTAVAVAHSKPDEQTIRQIAADVVNQLSPAIAWDKARDYVFSLWQEWISYRDPRLYNLIWNRVVGHLEHMGLIPAGQYPKNRLD